VGGLTYFRALDCDRVRTALKLLAGEPAVDRPRGTLQETFNESGLSSIELLPPFRFVTGGQRSELTVNQAYDSAAEVLAETLANLQAGRLANPLPVRRIVNDLLDATTGKDLARIAFEVDTTAPEFARHPLAVTNHSLLIGRAIGLPEASLADLGIAAMLHDVGFYGQDDRRQGPHDDHTWIGFRILLRQRGFHEARIRRLLVMIEHHARFDRPGRSPSLHARIIHIADDYDALTRLRSDSTPALVPIDALRAMAAAAGAYDPTALQLFLNALGAFPPGSVLRLADGTLVVVLSGVRDPQLFDKPRCKVVRLADGSDPQRELWVDLAKGGRIVEVLGSRLRAAGAEPEEPPPPPRPGPPPAPPVFGSPYLRAPRPPKPPKGRR
jgi:hypothetical protein